MNDAPTRKQAMKSNIHELHENTQTADVGKVKRHAITMDAMGYLLQTMRTKRISMTSLQAVLILYMNQSRQMSLTKLAKHLGITTAATTSTADGLEQLKFARREISCTDRRLTHIKLTPQGLAFAEWFSGTLHERISDDSLDGIKAPYFVSMMS